MLLDGKGDVGNFHWRCADWRLQRLRFHALGDAFARCREHRKLVNMQAGALQAVVQGLGGLAGRRLQRP